MNVLRSKSIKYTTIDIIMHRTGKCVMTCIIRCSEMILFSDINLTQLFQLFILHTYALACMRYRVAVIN